MNRRKFVFLKFAAMFCCGFFIFTTFAQADVEILLPINKGNLDDSKKEGWEYVSCSQGAPSGNNYIVMTSTESSIISPKINLSSYATAEINFKFRTYDNSSTTSNFSEITIFVSDNNGQSWEIIYKDKPISSTLTKASSSLTDFIGKDIIIKFSTLSANGGGAGIDDIEISGIPKPIYILSADAGPDQEVEVGEEIIFNASSSTGEIIDYLWDFGDGTTSTGATSTHIYDLIGEYNVTLLITDIFNGTSSDTMIVSIIAKEEKYMPIPGDIIINEFQPDPNDNEKEWIEFYNNTQYEISLDKWTVSENASTINISGIIPAYGFYTLEFDSAKLNNAGDEILLKNDKSVLIDYISYGSFNTELPAPGKGNSLALKNDGINTKEFIETITPSKNLPNIITPKPVKIITSGANNSNILINNSTSTATSSPLLATTTETFIQGCIKINEIFPRPSIEEKNNEFIELKNLSTSTINLTGWFVTDMTGKKFKITTSSASLVKPGGLYIIFRSSSSIALNNSGKEIVSIYSPDGILIDSVEYLGPVSKDYSWSRNLNGEYLWTSVATPSVENIFLLEEDDDEEKEEQKTAKVKTSVSKSTTSMNPLKQIIEVPLIQIKNLNNGQKIKAKGNVSVLPGILGAQIFYISGTGGIQIYSYKKDFPLMEMGDLVEIIGEVSEAGGEKRIKTTSQKDIKIISKANELITEEYTIEELDNEKIGSLIKLKGTVIEIKSPYIYIDDGNNEIRIHIKPSTGINVKEIGINESDIVEVTGILSISSSGLRVLPRLASDINKIGEVKSAYEEIKPTIEKTQNSSYYFWAIIIFLIAINIFVLFKKKHSE